MSPSRYWLLSIIICIGAGCANIVPPTGGKKDITPPKLLAVTPKDSLLDTKVTKIEFHYNEFIELKDAKEIQVSPLLPVPPTIVVAGKKATLKIPDSLISENTTYRISLGKSIADLHEANPIQPYTYVFSTAGYFDSLQLGGTVIDAATGKPDSGVLILLYPATKSDSVVVRERPLYIGRGNGGRFAVSGLPDRHFRIYALKDGNDNLIYDGGTEKIAFIDSIVSPADSITSPIVLKLFEEKQADTATGEGRQPGDLWEKKRRGAAKGVFSYGVSVDTSDKSKRTLDITQPLNIIFTGDVDSLNTARMSLAYDSVVSDSVSIEVEVPFTADTDTVRNDILYLSAAWKENTLYTLRLLKGFVKDTARNDVMPSKYKFRTKSDADYSKLRVQLPGKYLDSQYVLLIKNDKDTIHMKTVTDTVVSLTKLQPGTYNMFIIEDENKNGKWDTGDLFEKRQPENVIPFSGTMQLRAGWENIFDFETKEKKQAGQKGQSPQKRDRGFGK